MERFLSKLVSFILMVAYTLAWSNAGAYYGFITARIRNVFNVQAAVIIFDHQKSGCGSRGRSGCLYKGNQRARYMNFVCGRHVVREKKRKIERERLR